MIPKIAIIDYSIGNLFSVHQACLHVGISPFLAKEESDLRAADGVILPGVGAFGQGVSALKRTGFDTAIDEFIKTGKPFMGICLGMQLLLDSSEEFGETKGLGLIKGTVKSLRALDPEEKAVPKITWDTITGSGRSWDNTPLRDVPINNDFYFVHSFYCECTKQDDVLAYSAHGSRGYPAAILKDNIFATQFHPEKSGMIGLELYKNWKKNF